ncbi:MAG: DUF58 domain-containing protein [Planctomycetota bacterium]|jgi:uncharacterized protein (DUF58 family)
MEGSGASASLFGEDFVRRARALAGRLKALRGPSRRARSQRSAGLVVRDRRPYAPGDELRRLDWNLFARTERLHTRVYEQLEELSVLLLVDTSASMQDPEPRKAELALQLTGAAALVALEQGHRVEVAGLGGATGPIVGARGTGRAEALLSELARVPFAGVADWTGATEWVLARRSRRQVAVIAVSDFLVDPPEQAPQAVAALTQAAPGARLARVLSEEEAHPQLPPRATLVCAETGRKLEVSGGPEAEAAYAKRLAAQEAELEATCRRTRASLVRVGTRLGWEEAALRVLAGSAIPGC